MNQLSVFQAQNAQIDATFNSVLAGTLDVTVAQAASGLMNAKTRRLEIELKRAAKAGFLKEIAGQWRAEHLPQTVV